MLRTIQKAVKIVFIIAVCLGITVFAVGMLKSEGFSASLIAALTLAMASIPEEFPLVFTLYLSLAAYRLSKKGILVKSLPAVEGLARVNVICTDKTGTLTEGKFQLEKFHTPETSYEYISESLVFSCELKAVDAMEVSIFEFVTKNKGASFIANVQKDWVLEYDYQFNTHEKYMSHVWKNKSSGIQTIAMKGSIEGVLAHCKDFAEKQRFLEISKTEAEAGKRLLGLAGKIGKFTGHRTEDEKELDFLGILIFTDPVRPSVKAAVKTCVDQNIRIKMLTGDHLLTAHAIADRIGLPHEHDQLFTGPELEKMQSDSKRFAYQRGAIFARLKPEQKLELVQALKNEGDIVAMTGDGVNDAPALKLADVGISMGEHATDVARSTAQLVLLKNDFNGIVASILEGERVLKSLADSFGYLVAFHVPIIGIVLIQSFFLNVPILYPIHIVLMELIVHPVSGFVFDENVFLGSQRQKTFLTKKRILASSLRGILLTAISLGIFLWTHGTVSNRQSLAVLTLVIGNAGLLLAEKGLSSLFMRVRALKTVMAVTLLLLLAFGLAYFPLLGRLFSITSPQPHEFIIALAAGLAVVVFPNARPVSSRLKLF